MCSIARVGRRIGQIVWGNRQAVGGLAGYTFNRYEWDF